MTLHYDQQRFHSNRRFAQLQTFVCTPVLKELIHQSPTCPDSPLCRWLSSQDQQSHFCRSGRTSFFLWRNANQPGYTPCLIQSFAPAQAFLGVVPVAVGERYAKRDVVVRSPAWSRKTAVAMVCLVVLSIFSSPVRRLGGHQPKAPIGS